MALIAALQQHIPKELRRHETQDALAGAIHRARKSNWWPRLLPPNLTDEERAFLETLGRVRKENQAIPGSDDTIGLD